MKTLSENLKTYVGYDCDVLVAGGGFAGIASALAAARNGAKTILLEREFMLGGLGTLGLITIYLPICDGNGRQVSFGIAEELLKLSIKYGAQDRYPKAWLENGTLEDKKKKRFEVQYNPHIFAHLAEQLLIEAGVKILYGTSVCAVNKTGDRISEVITESKGGRCAISVKNVVDATGDADVCAMSGEDVCTNPFKNNLAGWYYGIGKDGQFLRQLGAADIPEDHNGENCVAPISNKKYDGLDAEEITDFMINSRKKAIEDILAKREAGDRNLEPSFVPVIPQLRMTRRVAGVLELTEEHSDTRFENSVGMVGNWRRKGPVIEVPYTCLYGEKVKNLITAGRCISASGNMWDIMRVIPVCAVTGQAAGTAAAFGVDFADVDVKKLQEKLVSDSVVLHISDLEEVK